MDTDYYEKVQRFHASTIRDVILTCARKPIWVSLIYRTEPTSHTTCVWYIWRYSTANNNWIFKLIPTYRHYRDLLCPGRHCFVPSQSAIVWPSVRDQHQVVGSKRTVTVALHEHALTSNSTHIIIIIIIFITPTGSKTVTYSTNIHSKNTSHTKYHTNVKIKAQKSVSTLYCIREHVP